MPAIKVLRSVREAVLAGMGERIIGICALFMFVTLLPYPMRGVARPTNHSICNQTTVDEYYPDSAQKAKQFLAQLKAAIEAGNKQRVASMVAYPVRVFERGKKTRVRNKAEFIARYRDLITAAVKKAVMTQHPDCLFANYQGIMIGNGEVWFVEEPNDTFKIITINN